MNIEHLELHPAKLAKEFDPERIYNSQFGATSKRLRERFIAAIQQGVLIPQTPHKNDYVLNPKYMYSQFSYFKAPVRNTIPSATINLPRVFKAITSDYLKDKTEKIRAISNKKDRSEYKSKVLPFVTFSGAFTKRNANSLIEHSNYLCLDFDDLPDVKEAQRTLLSDTFLDADLLFTSPSGNGLKMIIEIQVNYLGKDHKEWFNDTSEYIQLKYGYEVDKSGKDVCRNCFLCYDPECYINPKYELT